ncbi:MAG: hypothetical protein IIZ73_09680 [Ruminococcus sp.]|nr:hypothetical protein [Ruminococcus sp.]
MKRFAAMALALVMCLSFAACGSSSDKDGDDEKETKASASESEEKAADTDAVTETETEPEEPKADVESIELTNELLGFKLTFDVPKFEGWEIGEPEQNGASARKKLKYNYEVDGSKTWCSVDVALVADSTNGLDWSMEQNEPIPNTEYTGYITGHSKSQDCPMNFYTEDYLDGKVRADIDVSAISENMDADKYSELLETIQKSVKVEILDTNGLYDTDGNLLTVDGLFSIPPSVNIGGTDAQVIFKTYSRTLHARTDFNDGEDDISIHEAGNVNGDLFESFIEKHTDDKAYDCEVGGYPARGRLWNDFGTLTAEYIVQFDDETFYEFYVTSKGSLDLAAINEMMNGAERGDLEKKMNGHLNDFVAAMKKL